MKRTLANIAGFDGRALEIAIFGKVEVQRVKGLAVRNGGGSSKAMLSSNRARPDSSRAKRSDRESFEYSRGWAEMNG
jgi:hypothetical protein